MHPIDIEKCLDSMVILVDTREQPSKRAERRYKSFLCPYKRKKLDFGDYSAEFLLNDKPILLNVAIERKMSLDELASCFTRDRERFKREFERASSVNATVYLLVENATWENLLSGGYRSKFNSAAYLGSLVSWMVRYNLKPIFCKSETSGKLIYQILYRELKVRLERGDFG